ncbi:PACE efflux transporter [uncultured Pseudodesulfovibrio sp.]|uniref:PACE efflux transporter n=1 Tax=uncultured Pseudodesulfovibrio sp. TaxID=2035858 RepID=UPI0029C90CAF|nr:PACE efflux transporter [uncultured Pseudodesulfovibrio sp.]
MRTQADRIRHTIMFEVIGLLTCVPLAAWILERDILKVGTMSMVISLTAMGCNYLFNIAFDHLLVKLGRRLNDRPPWLRCIHAVSFEASLLILTVPFVAWWLDLSLWAAFITDIGFAVFFLVYAYFYNWAYDAIFPMPADQPQSSSR